MEYTLFENASVCSGALWRQMFGKRLHQSLVLGFAGKTQGFRWIVLLVVEFCSYDVGAVSVSPKYSTPTAVSDAVTHDVDAGGSVFAWVLADCDTSRRSCRVD